MNFVSNFRFIFISSCKFAFIPASLLELDLSCNVLFDYVTMLNRLLRSCLKLQKVHLEECQLTDDWLRAVCDWVRKT